jgi:hypothetical protein
MTNTSREVGGVFGIALLGTILTTKLKSAFVPAIAALGLPGDQASQIAAAAGHGRISPDLLAGLSPDQIAGVRQAFAAAFMDGFHIALTVGGSVLIVAAFVAFRFIPGRADLEAHHAEQPVLAAAH